MSVSMGISCPPNASICSRDSLRDFADMQVSFGSEENVVLETVGMRPQSRLLKAPQAFVVLVGRQVRGVEAGNDAHDASLHAWGRADPTPDWQAEQVATRRAGRLRRGQGRG